MRLSLMIDQATKKKNKDIKSEIVERCIILKDAVSNDMITAEEVQNIACRISDQNISRASR